MIIDGTAIANEILSEIKGEIAKLNGSQPTLAFVLVGDNPASEAYIRMKKKRCDEVGILSKDQILPADLSESALLTIIDTLNKDRAVDGILVQLPLPKQIRSDKILEAIDPTKDVDGFHPLNMGKLLLGEEGGFISCTPLGIQTLLARSEIETAGKHVVILGRSNIVGKPLANLLLQKKAGANATITVVHSGTQNIPELCKTADILIAAIGSPGFVTKDMVKEGAVVIDVGINRVDDRLVGDVAYEEVAKLASAITPVPGGVGPMTIALLLSNTLLSYKRRRT